MCNTCTNALGAIRITNNQFDLVKNEFLNKVVKGKDIYQKTTPEEWQRFERVIEENRPFDIVMDGLNVAYLANKKNAAFQLGSSALGQHSPKKGQKPCAYSV